MNSKPGWETLMLLRTCDVQDLSRAYQSIAGFTLSMDKSCGKADWPRWRSVHPVPFRKFEHWIVSGQNVKKFLA